MESTTTPSVPESMTPSQSGPAESTPASEGVPIWKRPIFLIIGGVVLFIILIILVVISVGLTKPNSKESAKTDQSAKESGKSGQSGFVPSGQLPYLFIYATIGNPIEVKSYNLSSGEEKTLVSLPSDIKKITLLPDKVLFINHTDEKDHGSEISSLNLKDKATTSIYKAESGFGIDEYILSPNSKYLLTWEVSFAAGSQVLLGARSRVYSFDISTSKKSLIYDEIANPTNPIHYPRAITDSGEIFVDGFIPGNGPGWAYGMSTTNLDGTIRQDLDNMKNGTYGTQPKLSPDGKTLAFAGYDGNGGSGEELVDGYRRSILVPNTVELYNIATKTREKLTSLSNENSYTFVDWDKGSGDLQFTQLGTDKTVTGFFTYNLATKNSTQVHMDNQKTFLASFGGKSLVASSDPTPSNIKNLGSVYTSSLNEIDVLDQSNSKVEKINLKDDLIQFIDVVPVSFLIASKSQNVLGVKQEVLAAEKSLQLKNFVPSLSPTAIPHSCMQIGCPTQPPTPTVTVVPYATPSYTYPSPTTFGGITPRPTNTPFPTPTPYPTAAPVTFGGNGPCDQFAASQCFNMSPVVNSASQAICRSNPNVGTGCIQAIGQSRYQQLISCYTTNKRAGFGYYGACFSTPLYIYGQSGQKIDVTLGNGTKKKVTILGNGNLDVNGITEASIGYNFSPTIKNIVPPTQGIVAKQSDLAQTVVSLSEDLGLNQKETTDLVLSTSKISSPYVFVSYFDQNMSKKILPLQFNPTPETYINIVFYLKPLNMQPNSTPQPPKAVKVDRRGLTAVEISEYIDGNQ